MRYFQSFFKHTWRPQQVYQMEPPSRFEPTKMTTEMYHAGDTELNEVQIIAATSVAASVSAPAGSPHASELPCRNGCKGWRSRSESRSESPWHSLKTIFLVSVIMAFVLWVVVYTLLNQYRIL